MERSRWVQFFKSNAVALLLGSVVAVTSLSADTVTTSALEAGDTGALAITSDGVLSLNAGEGSVSVDAQDAIVLHTSSDSVVLGTGWGDILMGTSAGVLTLDTSALSLNALGGAIINGRSIASAETGVVLDAVISATVETVAASIDLDGPRLVAGGGAARVTIWGSQTVNANAKTLRLRLGADGSGIAGTLAATLTLGSTSGTAWRVSFEVRRTGVDAQLWRAEGVRPGNVEIFSGTAALDDASILELTITGQPATSGELTVGGYQVELL